MKGRTTYPAVVSALLVALGARSASAYTVVEVRPEGGASMRATPDGVELGTARQGARFGVKATRGEWLRVEWRERAAWVSSALVKRVAQVSDRELEILARIVKGEALVCSFKGKVAVAAVVLNRVRARGFPKTIAGVAHQPWQFSCYNPGVRARLYGGRVPAVCFRAARAAVEGQDPTKNATYYFNPYLVLPSWARSMRFLVRIGTNRTNTHVFYRPR